MSILVEQQEETINAIETTAAAVEKDTEAGYARSLLVGNKTNMILLVSTTPARLWTRRVLLGKSDGYAS